MTKAKPGYKLVKSLFGKYDEIPENWGYVICSDVFDLKHGYQFGHADFVENKGIKVLRIEQITVDGTINLDNCDSIDVRRLKDFEYILIREGDVLISLTGELIKPALVPKINELVLQNYRVGKCVSINKNKLFQKYIFYLLNSFFVMKQFFMLRNVQAQPNIGKADFDKIKTPLPPLNEQKKITVILSNLDSLISSYDKTIIQTNNLKKGLIKKLFTSGIGHKKFKKISLGGQIKMQIPYAWEVRKFGEIITSTGLGTNQVGLVGGPGIPLLKMGNLTYGGFNYKKLEKLIPSEIENIDKYLLKENDFLFNTRNTDVLVGKCSVWKNDFPQTVFNNNLMRIKFSESIENPDYVSYFLNGGIGRRSLRRLVDATTSVAAIYIGSLKLLKFPLPPIEEQQKITDMLNSIGYDIINLQSKKSNLKSLKKGLMQKLFTGQIRV